MYEILGKEKKKYDGEKVQFEDSSKSSFEDSFGLPERNSSFSENIVQRLVSNNLRKPQEVYIIRSTSRDLHGAKAQIVEYLEGNKYLVEVSGTQRQVVARSDQLSLYTPYREVPEVEARLDELIGDGREDLFQKSKRDIGNLFEGTEFIIGGSFAVMLEAFKSGMPARTPRDIDIFVSSKDYNKLKEKRKELYGLPIEVHRLEQFKRVEKCSDIEKNEGFMSKSRLLSLEITKLAKDTRKGRDIIIESLQRSERSALNLIKYLFARNEEFMEDTEDEYRKEVWIKTLVDIKTLAESGAELDSDLSFKQW